MATLVGNICLDSKCPFFNQSAFWWKTRPDCFKRGGKICYVVKGAKRCYALSAADTASALIAVEAKVIIQKLKEERRIPIEALYTGDSVKPHALDKEEVVTGVILPPPSKGWLGGFLKESLRGSVDFPIASLSLRLKMADHSLEDIRIVLNGVSTRPVRARGAEASLKGRHLNEETIHEAVELILQEASPISLIGATASYRRAVIRAMFVKLMNSEIGREV
jgi:4-hydroxybenzoyl-CoA reductase subunit beta